MSKPETRQVLQQEIFPKRNNGSWTGIYSPLLISHIIQRIKDLIILDTDARINANGKLINPKKAWGGIMRNIDQTDFETSNIEFIEFWMQDPFIKKPASTGGRIVFQSWKYFGRCFKRWQALV